MAAMLPTIAAARGTSSAHMFVMKGTEKLWVSEVNVLKNRKFILQFLNVQFMAPLDQTKRLRSWTEESWLKYNGSILSGDKKPRYWAIEKDGLEIDARICAELGEPSRRQRRAASFPVHLTLERAAAEAFTRYSASVLEVDVSRPPSGWESATTSPSESSRSNAHCRASLCPRRLWRLLWLLANEWWTGHDLSQKSMKKIKLTGTPK